MRKDFHFIGDLEYSQKSFILTPYFNAAHGTPENNYNYVHSLLRISVECCLGEIDLQFGIFRRPLKYFLKSFVVLLMLAFGCTTSIWTNLVIASWNQLIRKFLMRIVGVAF